MKYLILASKLELIKNGKNPNQKGKFQSYVYYTGIAFNIACGVIYGVPPQTKVLDIISYAA